MIEVIDGYWAEKMVVGLGHTGQRVYVSPSVVKFYGKRSSGVRRYNLGGGRLNLVTPASKTFTMCQDQDGWLHPTICLKRYRNSSYSLGQVVSIKLSLWENSSMRMQQFGYSYSRLLGHYLILCLKNTWDWLTWYSQDLCSARQTDDRLCVWHFLYLIHKGGATVIMQ